MKLDLDEILADLRSDRPVFHSEADFQHALAWAIHEHHPSSNIRLEVPFEVPAASGHLDLLVSDGNRLHAIEIKYKTRGLSVKFRSEHFRLKSQSAQDLGRYDFFHDIQRIEALCSHNTAWLGWVVFLTNDSSYWNKPGRPIVAYEDFRMDKGRSVSGTLSWGNTAGEGTMKGRENPILVSSIYKMKWREYSDFERGAYSEFRYLLLPVGNEE